ncbi:YhcN/YlaJ family sporulation lipoprotein [Lachnospiraceae bacterium 46-61]
MKKIIFSVFCCSMMLTACRSNTLENNLSQIRIARAAELEQGKTKSERAKEIKQNILQLEEIQQAAVIIEGKTALIGLRLKEDSQKDVVRLKSEADILAKEADENIDGTAITANENITAMIEKMEKEREIS